MGGSTASRPRGGRAPTGASRDGGRVAAVTAVAEASTSLMALLYGSFLGALSALLVVNVAMRALPVFEVPLQRAALGLAAWVVSTWLISRHAKHLLAVFRRAFLLGAVEWLALDLAGGRELLSSASTGAAPAVSGSIDPLTGGVATVMLCVCLAGYLVCRWSGPPSARATPPIS